MDCNHRTPAFGVLKCDPSPISLTNNSPNWDTFGNDSVTYYAKKYLDVGERTFDYTSAWFGSSEYFKRN